MTLIERWRTMLLALGLLLTYSIYFIGWPDNPLFYLLPPTFWLGILINRLGIGAASIPLVLWIIGTILTMVGAYLWTLAKGRRGIWMLWILVIPLGLIPLFVMELTTKSREGGIER